MMAKSVSQPSLSSHHSLRNVVVVGETGVGKSSFINLVTGTNSAPAANDVGGVTTDTTSYLWEMETRAFRLWDTPGLGEGSFGKVSSEEAQQALRSLLEDLAKRGGVHLLVICMRGVRHVIKGMKQTYDTILGIRDQVSHQIPVVAVVTELEKRCQEASIVSSMEEWWTSNASALAANNMVFYGHVCLTTVTDDDHPPTPGRRVECQRIARTLLIDHSLPFTAFGASTPLTISTRSSRSFKFDRNIVVVGETGVGKSSFINLVTGSNSAVTANDIAGVTTRVGRYLWETETHAFRLWDTPGLGEGSLGNVSPKAAQQVLLRLLKRLAEEGGVHLLVICMRGVKHVIKGMKQTYDTILGIRNQVSHQIPVVAVVTELEKRCDEANIVLSMEGWWTTNERTLTEFGMAFRGHACLTTVTDGDHPPIPGRRDECQQLARKLLIDYALPPIPFSEPTRVINGLPGNSFGSACNIVVMGESGIRKSSFIHLVTGQDAATNSGNIRGVTTGMSFHLWDDRQTHAFRLWDTPGLGEESSHEVAQHVLRFLLRELAKEGGIHLIVVCIRGMAQITKGTKQTYDTILRIRNQTSPQIPVVAAVTEMEKRSGNMVSSMDEWWARTLAEIETFCGHVCLTALPDDCHSPMLRRHAECQRLARDLLVDHALPLSPSSGFMRMINVLPGSSTSPKLTRNIVVVGETGVGKSSTVNLVTGTNSAFTANDVRAVTVGTSYHDWTLMETQAFRLWDTPGLGEGPDGSTPAKHAQKAVRSLLTELSRSAGVHLIIVCLRGRQVTKRMKQAYDTIVALRDAVCPDVPLVAVVTELEPNSRTHDVLGAMEQWWYANANALSDNHMIFAGHACITNLSDDARPPIPRRRNECQRLVRDLVIDHALTPRSIPSQDLHVVLFGETGAGKSSLVNLLAGWPVAGISTHSSVPTLASAEYQFQLGAATICLWDTAGLIEPKSTTNDYLGAVEKAAELIRRLSTAGGISLFLFCIKESTMTEMMAMQRNYRLFYEVLGKKHVPIALVVTHLEKEPIMEDWWQRNAQKLEMHGIRVGNHVCLTTLKDHPKYAASKEEVQGLLRRYADQGKFSMPSETWLGRLLSELNLLLGYKMPRGKDLTQILMKRCYLESEVAQRVADCIERKMDG